MIRRELAIFLVVGTLTVVIDFLTYRGLIWAQLLGVDSAKGIGFLTGTVFAYFANRFWTFGHKVHAVGSAWRFIVVYSLTLGTNVLVNSFLIAWLPSNVPALLDELIAASKFVSAYNPIYHEMNIILSKILSKETAIQIAFLVATVTSATLNFIGMKLFVFKTTPVLEQL
jgi:putative flippase GtrA